MYWTYLRRELSGRKKQTAIVAIGLAIAIALVIIVNSLSAGIRDAQAQALESVYGVGTGIGWALAIVALAAIRERLRYADIPKGLQGLGIAFIVTGLLSMAFSAFVGVRVL